MVYSTTLNNNKKKNVTTNQVARKGEKLKQEQIFLTYKYRGRGRGFVLIYKEMFRRATVTNKQETSEMFIFLWKQIHLHKVSSSASKMTFSINSEQSNKEVIFQKSVKNNKKKKKQRHAMLKVKKVMGCKNNDNFFRIYVHKTKKHKKKIFC